jgi:hypothetical protein
MKRPNDRYKVDFQVDLNWEEKPGAVHRAQGRCTDLSASGAQVELRDAIKPRTLVVVSSREFGRMGSATVRYCRRDGMKYSVGLEFTAMLALSGPARVEALAKVLLPE